jgi:hypothetical protein
VNRLASLLLWARGFAKLPADLEQVYSRVRELQLAIARPPPPPPPPPAPFVCVLVEGTRGGSEGFSPITAGATGRLYRGQVCVELTTNILMHDCRVTVFADLERVDVGGIFVGADYMHAQLGVCPIAYFAAWHPGVKLMVQAAIRTSEGR